MVRTRFAPSPTGYLHIGGVRTALFNWLFARRHGGQFLLRIDDTDMERNVEAALAPILHGLRWMGIDWDEGPEVGGPFEPYFQSKRLDKYQAAVERLLAGSFAYRDYATPDELQVERTAAEAEKRPFIYSRKWMAKTAGEQVRFESEGRKAVVRLKMPREGKLIIPDLVRGDVEFDWAREQDHVVQRADGTCLYHLASVVDDFDFQITHVIRAEEHLSNTPRQIFIAQSLGFALPQYAHLPYVAEPGSKNKLSKRKLDKYLKNADFARVHEHGLAIASRIGLNTTADTFNPVIVDFYEQVGYLPEAILNYLVLLGWSLDDKTESLTVPQMIEYFSLERVNKAPASFDPKKLWAFQDRYMQQVPVKQKVAKMVPYLQRADLVPSPVPCEVGPLLTRIVEAAGDRIKVFGDILDYSYFFVSDNDLQYDERALQTHLTPPRATLLRDFRMRLDRLTDFNATGLRMAVHTALRPHLGTGGDFSETLVLHQIDALQRDLAAAGSGSFDARTLETSVMSEFLRTQQIKIGEIINAIRVAITGQAIGPGLFDCMEILGRESCIRRIDFALKKIGRDNWLPQEVLDLPQALEPVFPVDVVNLPVRLFDGELVLQRSDASTSGVGTIELEWVPSASVRFHANVERPISPEAENFLLKIPSKQSEFECHLTALSMSNKGISTSGVLQGRNRVGNGKHLSHIVFHVTNFHSYLGDGIRKDTALWRGRLVLLANDWIVTLDSLLDSDKRLREVAKQGGSAVTHVGKIERASKAPFDAGDSDLILEALQYYLSFVRGFWTAPTLPVGFDQNGARAWEDWTLRRFDEWRSVTSWCPVFEMEPVANSFSRFVRDWENPDKRETIRTAVYWYLLSNRGGAVDNSVVTSQIILEVLEGYLREPSPTAAGSHDLRSSSCENLQSLLESMHVTTKIPEGMKDLQTYAERVAVESGPSVLRRIRDELVHPRPVNSVQKNETKLPRMMREAWDLSLWYAELLLLRAFDYNGRYLNRTTAKWTSDTEQVPWQTNPDVTKPRKTLPTIPPRSG